MKDQSPGNVNKLLKITQFIRNRAIIKAEVFWNLKSMLLALLCAVKKYLFYVKLEAL